MAMTDKQLEELSKETDEAVRTTVSALFLAVKGETAEDAENQMSAIMAGMAAGFARILWSLKADDEGVRDCVEASVEMLTEAFRNCKAGDLGAIEAAGNA